MLSFAAFLLVQTKPKIDPRIAQVWTAAAATGLQSATLSLGADGRFSMSFVEDSGKRETIQGTYTVGSGSESQGAKARTRVLIMYDLASLLKAGMPKAEVEALRKRGEKGKLGMQLTYFPEVPVLTDLLTAHFVPVRGQATAMKRLEKWKPF